MAARSDWTLAQQVMIDLGRVVLGGLFRTRVAGLEHLPRQGGCLVICSHPTLLDPILLTLALPRRTLHLANRTNREPASLAYFLDLFEVAGVGPQGNALAAMRDAMAALHDGRLVTVFPEGGLSDNGVLRPFRPGAAMLALETDCTVVPAAVCGSFEAWPPRAAWPRPRPVTVRFGPPLDLRRARRQPRGATTEQLVLAQMRAAVAAIYTPTDPRRR